MHMACDDTCFSENNQFLHDKLTKMSKFSFSVWGGGDVYVI